MKKFLLGIALLLSTACPLFGQSTTGYHRTNQILARGPSGLNAQVVPYAKITVFVDGTQTPATIYSDPLLSSQITPPVVTADASGNYDYYIPLQYCVDEGVSAPGQGNFVTRNICVNASTTTGIINPGTAGQFPYYAADGRVLSPLSPAAALADLHGISSVITNPQTMAGPLLTTLHDKGGFHFDTQAFGAVGDCTPNGSTSSCTDNCIALNSLFSMARLAGGIVFWSGRLDVAQTTYYTSCTVNPLGVSMEGLGPGDATAFRVGVRGAPAKDVFAPGDPLSPGYITPAKTFHVTNLSVFVDDSVDASASFPNRKPGKTIWDVNISSSSAVLNSATMLALQGDAGQAIRVYGAGPGGTDLDTTIASVQSPTQVTLSATASTSVTTGKAYLSVMNLPVTATIGNCGWAYDNGTYDHSYADTGINGASFTNVQFSTTTFSHNNNTCGMMFQGNSSPYGSSWDKVFVRGMTFGMAFIPAPLNAANGGDTPGIADINSFNLKDIDAKYSWISYGGNQNSLTGVQIFTGMGPHFLSISAAAGVPREWKLDIAEEEGGCTPFSLTPPCDTYRITGNGWQVDRLHSMFGNMQWDASFSKVNVWFPNETNINISGNSNDFFAPYFEAVSPTAYNVTGFGNRLITCGGSGSGFAFNAAKCQYADLFNGFAPASIARGSIQFDRKADFLRTGSAYYFNDDDLWLWPQDVHDAFGTATVVVPDSTSPTDYTLNMVDTTNYFLGSSGTSNVKWTFGKQIPLKFRAYVTVKASTAVTGWTFSVETASFTNLCTITANLTTSYQTFYCDADASAHAGENLLLATAAVGTGKTGYIQWIGLRATGDLVGSSVQIGAGTPMTANHGTGTSVQHSDGTGTSGNLAKYNADGSLTDGPAPPTGTIVGDTDTQTLTNKTIDGVAPANMVSASGPTVGQAACIKSAGPPLVIGYCSTVVGSGGACTCN